MSGHLCGALAPHLRTERTCERVLGHDGLHVVNDGCGRAEYYWSSATPPYEPAPDLSADLTPAQAARLEAIEAAPYAEEALVERVARVLWLAEEDVFGWVVSPWDRISETTRNHFRRLAVAAIDVMRGAADDGAIGRVLALADELDTEASECKDLGRRYREGNGWVGAAVCDGKSWTSQDAATRIRAAVGAPATAEGDGWTQIAPGYWRRDEPIDEQAARALMEERLAERGDR